ncbi:MAG: ImmA/IrrE family metallo-endopeptidase [Christensenellaceae bacterium]|jgi:Zn-dependent peptidase ImmA (M78 family)|nr:ImmA/IrrE family metallo-endopeptidase [Christensenellaceae bacterium]
MDKVKIENAALNIYTEHIKRGTPAKSLAKIIKAESLWFSEIKSDSNSFLGALVKVPDYPPHIIVRNNITPSGRKNFTIAHELGHYILGHNLYNTSIFCNNINEEDETISKQENEANYFARCFLLPHDRIIKEFTNWFRYRVSQTSNVFLKIETQGSKWQLWKAVSGNLTKKFAVSEITLKIRLIELKLINNF